MYNAYPYYGDSDYYVTVANTTSGGAANAYASLESEVKSDSTSVRLNASGTYQTNKVVATTTYPNSSTGTNVTGTFSKYIANDTVFTAVEGVKSDIASKTATGSMKMAMGDPKFVAIVYKSNSNKAAYVVYAASDLGGAVSGSDNIIYVDGTQGFTKNTTDSTTNANVYAMSDNSSESIIIDGTDSYDGFYSYSTTSKNYYKLSAKSGTNITTNIGNSTDGYVDNLAVTYYDSDSNIISGTTGYIDGVKYGDAKVIDVRSAAEKDADVYTDSITSVNALNNAMKKCTANGTTSGVTLDVYVNDGKITFIAVEAIANTAGATTYTMTAATGTTVSLNNSTYASTVNATPGQTVYVKVTDTNTSFAFTTPIASAVTTVTAPATGVSAVYSFAAPAAATTIAGTAKHAVAYTVDPAPTFTATGSKLAMAELTLKPTDPTVLGDLDGTMTLTVYSANSVTGKFDISEKTMNVTVTDGVAAAIDIMTGLTPTAKYQVGYSITIDGVVVSGQSSTLTVEA